MKLLATLTTLTFLVVEAVNPFAHFGKTKFSDMTRKEFSESHGYKKPNNQSPLLRNQPIANIYTNSEVLNVINKSVDWRSKGVVLPIKDQQLCGSCWAFSAVANIESQLAIATGGLESLSEEQLVDCVTVDFGCQGGWPDDAFDYVQNNGITAESLYNYTAGNGVAGQCKTLNECQYITKIKGHTDIPNDEGQMLAYMQEHGPISIALDATTFQSYISGIVTDCISDEVDHAVLIVGYSPAVGKYPAYWIIRNSWGVDWGEDGYIRVAYGTNQCLITNKPSSSYI